MRPALARPLLVLALAAVPALGDEVVLKNGNKIQGRVVEEVDGKVVIATDGGTITIRRSQIAEIVPGPAVSPAPPAPLEGASGAARPASRPPAAKPPAPRKPAAPKPSSDAVRPTRPAPKPAPPRMPPARR